MMIMILVAFSVTSVGAFLPISLAEAEALSQELGSTREVIGSSGAFLTVTLIFGNNLIHSLVMFTPFFGPLYGVFVLYSTGRVIAAEAVVQRVNPLLLVFSVFALPHAWVEFLAYGLALSESYWLTVAVLRRRTREELPALFKAISICALLLLVAAVIETYLIIILS